MTEKCISEMTPAEFTAARSRLEDSEYAADRERNNEAALAGLVKMDQQRKKGTP